MTTKNDFENAWASATEVNYTKLDVSKWDLKDLTEGLMYATIGSDDYKDIVSEIHKRLGGPAENQRDLFRREVLGLMDIESAQVAAMAVDNLQYRLEKWDEAEESS